MNYQSPIEVIQTQMRNQIEREIYKAVMNVGVNVDREELLKALAYDRNQYQKGYEDREAKIVRCKDCRYGQYCTDGETTYQCFKWNSSEFGALHEQDWFCADGERKPD